MIKTINLPDIGEGVVEGEVISWLKKIGDRVLQDEPVVTVMTDKATVELPSPYPGVLSKIYVDEGAIAIKGKPLYSIETSENHENGLEEKETAKAASFKENVNVAKEEPKILKSQEGSIKATPDVRQIAKELGIDLSEIQGSGKEKRITLADLKNHLQKKGKKQDISSSKLADDELVPLHGIPRLMADKMALSKREAPHFSYFEQIDATRLCQLKDNFKKAGAKENIHITFMPFIIKAVSLCLNLFPNVNSTLDMETKTLRVHKHHNIGIAISTDQGLLVPVLKNVETLSLEKIIRSYDELIKKAKANKLEPSDLKESTVTISNFGSFGGSGRWATPVINYPEVAILALAKIQKQPMIKQNTLVIREALNISWSFDHRVVDGFLAAHFSSAFRNYLENPAQLI